MTKPSRRAFVRYDWQARVFGWFFQHGSHVPILEAELGLYMVHPMQAIVLECVAAAPDERQPVAGAACAAHEKAEARPVAEDSAKPAQREGLPVRRAAVFRLMSEARSDRADRVLHGPRPDEALALLFLHLLHATLGVWQPTIDWPEVEARKVCAGRRPWQRGRARVFAYFEQCAVWADWPSSSGYLGPRRRPCCSPSRCGRI